MAAIAGSLGIAVFVLTGIAIILIITSILIKLFRNFETPKLWKFSWLYQDIANFVLCLGLVFFAVYTEKPKKTLCDATGFLLLYGIFLVLLSHLSACVILLCIQNPGKSTYLSKFHRNVVIIITTPQIIFGSLLSLLPYVSKALFNTDVIFNVICFPIIHNAETGSTYGIVLMVFFWIILLATFVCDVISVLKLWKFYNRVNSAHNNVWQSQLLSQGKSVIKSAIVEHIICFVLVLIITVTIYLESTELANNRTWIVMTSLAVSAIVHGVLSNISDVMWASCCCRDSGAVKEPHRKLKKLELLKIEAPGKLHMKATWTIGKHATKRGLMKVYGVDHLKSWAQEIVMLGMLRRIQHPSLIQCLWTNSSNPYYETMTLISGEIVTSDSRIICLELTNGGTLFDFLHKCELPLPEPCQRMIVHDIAEGLFYLHHESILHNNLTTSCIYLKGSLQSMVLRAAVGDFEDAQIYGTLQMSLDSSLRDKKYFFLPDIRSFALIALEIVGKMCEKRFQNRYVNYNTENVPMKLNLENVISDEDEEFGAQYGYEAEDTYRMFDAVHPVQVVESDESENEEIQDDFESKRQANGSLENLVDRGRPMSPEYSANSLKHSGVYINDSDEDEEVANYNENGRKTENRPMSPASKGISKACKSPDISKSHMTQKETTRKSRKDFSRSQNSASALARNKSPPASRCFSPHQQVIGNRSASPDPMKDEKLLELRNETNLNPKQGKKERKISFSRKRSEENVFQKNKTQEAFVKSSKEIDNKRRDTWLSKPQSILKSITSNDTTVSVFKAKHNDEESNLDVIEEEDISTGQSVANKTRQIQVKEKPKAEVWDIIDEQYYKQVNKKANMLKKTVSSESRSSLWSFISTPEDLDDDDLDDILDCLPGMTDPTDLRKSEITINDILAERESANRQAETKKKFSLADLLHNKSKFELIDYYELLKARQITINDVPEDKREMLLNVVELKKEEKLRKEGKFVPTTVLKSDDMYENDMFPGASGKMSEPQNDNTKSKLVSFRQIKSTSSSYNTPQQDPRLERARSAPLKRPRTPMHKPSVTKPEINPAFNDTRAVTVAKRNKARAALKRAISTKNQQTFGTQDRGRNREQAENFALKYATVRKINAESSNEALQDNKEYFTVPVPTSESFSVTNVKPAKDIKRYTSFSSNESASSISSSVHHRRADVSLTSGELSSLSSQAESEHYETDGHMTDIECIPVGNKLHTKPIIKGPSSKVDSGFDSGSMSSEMSDAFMNRGKHFNSKTNGKGVVSSWARNCKMVDTLPNSPYNFSSKFMPPTEIMYTENHYSSEIREESDSGYSGNKETLSHDQRKEHWSRSPRRKVMSPTQRPITPSSKQPEQSGNRGYKCPPNSRPMSPDTRPMSPKTSTITQSSRPMSPDSRPMSPNVRPTAPYVQKQISRSMSPEARVSTPNGDRNRLKKSDTFSPGRKLSKPPSPQPNHARAKSLPRTVLSGDSAPEDHRHRGRSLSPPGSVKSDTASVASKRYRELVKQGVPLRTSVIDSSPSRKGRNCDLEPPDEALSRPNTADSMTGRPMDDEELFENLDANGFFAARPRSRSPFNKHSSPSRAVSPKTGSKAKSQRHERRKHRTKQIPLEEIVRENPSGKVPAHRSPSKNHLAVSEEAFLNQPTSEDSETCSIKTNKSNISTPSGSKPKVMVDAELVIDRIFSQNQPSDYELDVEVEAALGLDKDPFKAVNDLYLNGKSPNPSNLDSIPLLNGMGQKQIHGCMELASGLHVITVRDLLPANHESFTTLRTKLQQVGQLGNVGNQLLDVIERCWLLDMPPSSGDLVEQLTDPVTETEL